MLGRKLPRAVDMFAALSVGAGRDSTGRHRQGRPHDPALSLGMDTIGYMFKFEFKHEGLDDCFKQLLGWRPLIQALREHYLGV